jgi:hypothetical protein
LGTSLSSSIIELRSASKEIRDVETIMINDIIDEMILARIGKYDLENATIQSLAISLDLTRFLNTILEDLYIRFQNEYVRLQYDE